jgi:hypothetical protein
MLVHLGSTRARLSARSRAGPQPCAAPKLTGRTADGCSKSSGEMCSFESPHDQNVFLRQARVLKQLLGRARTHLRNLAQTIDQAPSESFTECVTCGRFDRRHPDPVATTGSLMTGSRSAGRSRVRDDCQQTSEWTCTRAAPPAKRPTHFEALPSAAVGYATAAPSPLQHARDAGSTSAPSVNRPKIIDDSHWQTFCMAGFPQRRSISNGKWRLGLG